ncbi:MAG: T9SS type A sorting domain-containing protein [Bacteroidetes bacterium]|nr:MAG: T9SS type A sorting domain-containing protein [Bacteroidota bacterium]
MKKIFLLVILILFPYLLLHGQLIREWKTVAEGHFTGTDYRRNLSIANGKYLAAVGYRPLANDTSIVLLSQDSGVTWQNVLKEKAINYDSLPGEWSTRFFQTVEMPSKNLIIIIGIEQMKHDVNKSMYPFIYRSTDFGKNWERIEISSEHVVFNFSCISMLDDNFGIMISGRNPTTEDSSTAALYKTTDGGLTWSAKPFPSQYPGMLKCFSVNDYVVGYDNKLFETNDGGLTWIKLTNPEGPLGLCSYINRNLWIVSARGYKPGHGDTLFCFIYKTTDGGHSWITLSDTMKSNLSFRTDFFDENNGLASGVSYSNFFRTTDGAKTWETEISPHESYMDAPVQIRFFDEEKALVLCSKRILLYSGNYNLKPPKVQYTKDSGSLLDYRLYWNRIQGGNKFKLQISESKPMQFPEYTIPDYDKKLILNHENLTDTSFSLTGKIKFNKEYRIRVNTYNDKMESDWSKMLFFKTPHDTAKSAYLDTCKQLKPNLNEICSYDSITFIWSKVKDASYYTLNVTTPDGFAFGLYDFIIENLTDTIYTLTKFKSDQQYIWWVVAGADDKENSPYTYWIFFTEKVNNVFNNNLINNYGISPNPAESIIFINDDNDSLIKKVEIYSILGNKVIETEYKDRIDVSELSAGVYFVKAGDMIYKFVKM